MAVISDNSFLSNVEKSLTIAHLSDLPLPFVVIKGVLYLNASREQIYGIMHLDGTPLSAESSGLTSKRFDTPASSLVAFYDMVSRLNSQIKQKVLNIAGESPPISPASTTQQYNTLYTNLFGPAGFFATAPKPLAASDIAVLGDLFKEILNRSKGIKLS